MNVFDAVICSLGFVSERIARDLYVITLRSSGIINYVGGPAEKMNPT